MAEVLVRVTVTGLPDMPAALGVSTVIVYFVDDALSFFAVVRLAQIVEELSRARDRTAGLAVAQTRLEAADRLQSAVDERLVAIAELTAQARLALATDPARASRQMDQVAEVAREAVARARAVTADQRDWVVSEPATSPSGLAVVGARLAWAVLVVVLLGFATQGVVFVLTLGYPASLTALALADITVVTALQLYHSHAARTGGRPRAWRVTLGIQAGLVYLGTLPAIAAYMGVLAPFLAGSVLLLVSGRRRWVGYAAVVGSWALLPVVVPMRGYEDANGSATVGLVLAAATAAVGLVVYGLARLVALARELAAMHAALARTAVVQERLRIARDVHDLLGLGLSAIALKADLVGRLITRNDARASAEIAEMSRICASARAEIRLVTGQGQRLTLAGELATGRQILTSAGVEVHTAMDAEPLPEVADDVLATVLREAITNVLRHSTAAACAIEVTTSERAVSLRVANDGVPDDAGDGRGSGIANLTSRVDAVGGRLTSRLAGGCFDLIAEVPR